MRTSPAGEVKPQVDKSIQREGRKTGIVCRCPLWTTPKYLACCVEVHILAREKSCNDFCPTRAPSKLGYKTSILKYFYLIVLTTRERTDLPSHAKTEKIGV